jgi:hypothetical protein
MNNLLPFRAGRAERFESPRGVPRDRAENPGHSQVVGGASITEASSGGDLGGSNTVIEQTQIGGSSPQYLVVTNGHDNPRTRDATMMISQ